jgi:hypothetical protein
MIKGAKSGLIVGVLVCVIAYIVAIACLPSQISASAAPFYCSDYIMNVIKVLTYPISFFTNDLATAPSYAVLTLAFYTVLGAIIGNLIGRKR